MQLNTNARGSHAQVSQGLASTGVNPGDFALVLGLCMSSSVCAQFMSPAARKEPQKK